VKHLPQCLQAIQSQSHKKVYLWKTGDCLPLRWSWGWAQAKSGARSVDMHRSSPRNSSGTQISERKRGRKTKQTSTSFSQRRLVVFKRRGVLWKETIPAQTLTTCQTFYVADRKHRMREKPPLPQSSKKQDEED